MGARLAFDWAEQTSSKSLLEHHLAPVSEVMLGSRGVADQELLLRRVSSSHDFTLGVRSQTLGQPSA